MKNKPLWQVFGEESMTDSLRLSAESTKAAKQTNQVQYEQNRQCQLACEAAFNYLANALWQLSQAKSTLRTHKDPAVAVDALCGCRDACGEVARLLHDAMRPIEIGDEPIKAI